MKTYSLLAKDVNGNRLPILLEACFQCLDKEALGGERLGKRRWLCTPLHVYELVCTFGAQFCLSDFATMTDTYIQAFLVLLVLYQ